MAQPNDTPRGLGPVAEPEGAERRRAGLPAPDTNERVQFALAAAHMGVFEWDVNSDSLTWSSTTGLGLSLEDAPASGRAFFELVHPDDRQALGEARGSALRDRTDVIWEFRTVTSDGAVHWVQAHGRVMYDINGNPERILGVNTDITRRKALEDQLHEAHAQVDRLKVLKATMRTVQDIVNNALMSLYLFRTEAEPCVSRASLAMFDHILADTAARLRALADLDHVAEKQMVMGAVIEYPNRPPIDKP